MITENISLGVDGGVLSLERKDRVKYNGIRYGATLFYNHFSLRLGRNDFEDFSEFVPTFKYHNSYKKNDYQFEYTRQNALFYTYAETPYEKRIKADHFSLSDNVLFENNNTLWANITLNLYDNDDREITAQFDYLFFKDTVFTPKFTYDFAVDGWYTSHSIEHSDFYSPSFADATLIRVDSKFLFTNNFGIKAKFGFGYSYSDHNTPYKYGAWIFGKVKKELNYSLGCLDSNAARLGYSSNYHYLECDANLGFKW